MSQTPPPDRRLVRAAALLEAAIACGAFVISYSALYSLALAANIVHPLAIIYSFLVDGFIVVASLAAVAMSGHPRHNTWYPWILLVVFFAFSVLGNAVQPTRDRAFRISCRSPQPPYPPCRRSLWDSRSAYSCAWYRAQGRYPAEQSQRMSSTQMGTTETPLGDC